ncbi:MAG: 16S rRNA (cytosine(967)-C(5))-methyltransferase RsmB, partial [Clostridia bacterium]|nr:16S rRNA (cytosine(967)-C(5))-methyltransferase RsmB [Clostridia bacterium]
MSEAIGARRAAYSSLLAFAKYGKYTNLEVASSLSKNDLSDKDKRLYTALVYGVAERIPTLDYVIGTLSSRGLEDIDIETLTCLRLGLYQLMYTDKIPDHAAVSETVSLAAGR